MTQMLPSLQAQHLKAGLTDFLATTFALSDVGTRLALHEFLDDPVNGIFKGPYVRLRLPFSPAAGTDHGLDWTPPFPPYTHQAEAYQRLTTRDLGPDKPRPRPTIVTTGTGSGKTEAFLNPILDHVLRARREGQSGMKALILYPMNALADDQARRLTDLICTDPALKDVRAALYTGDAREGRKGQGRTHVTVDGLITNREEIRQNPPDILLTNYKMLDQLLLRPADAPLWERSALSLTYLVLDEFHTYDGAQGTDVAMLLRRLGLVLKGIVEQHHPDHPEAELFAQRPLGKLTPVATSATLGSGSDPSAMLAFAEDVFGEAFDNDAAVTESRVTLEDFTAPAVAAVAEAGATPRRLAQLFDVDIDALAHDGYQQRGNPDQLVDTVLDVLYGPERPELSASDLLRGHPDIRLLLERCTVATPMAGLVTDVFGTAHRVRPESFDALAVILAALSHIRLVEGRGEASVEVTMWIREVSRVDRFAQGAPAFRWSDDGEIVEDTEHERSMALPAVYCRSCGRSGWGVSLAATGRDLSASDESIRGDHAQQRGRFRALLHAPSEAARYEQARVEHGTVPSDLLATLRWLDTENRTIVTEPPEAGDADNDRFLPVVMFDGESAEIEKRSKNEYCPSCERADSIRFLGSAVATLLSTSLTTLFGDEHLDSNEKRALVFTDSVQDAAHRAGFVESRSYAMSLRAGLRSALTEPLSLPEWVAAAMRKAADDEFARYRLVPPRYTDHDQFKAYWAGTTVKKTREAAAKHVERRLRFDASLEVGLQSTYGRTLTNTGSASAHVDAGRPESLVAMARAVYGGRGATTIEHAQLDVTPAADQTQLLRWVRGTLERLRRDGAIEHEWLGKYVKRDGARVWIWGKRPSHQGAPAFPRGRSAPAFAIVGGKPDENSEFVRVTSPKSWYARWAMKTLGVNAAHGASLAAALLGALAERDVLVETPTESGGRAYGIPADRIIVTPLSATDLESERILLVCDVCAAQIPTAPAIFDQLAGARCFTDRCVGTLKPSGREATSFYRDLFAGSGVRRVNAREHTSLLEAKDRKRIETEFKATESKGNYPNVLVATPTLEMGIDIGELTTVMLSSLPDSVAKYTQRVGRAGRATGSALALAYVTGRGDQLPQLGDPTALINGDVRPPATYLDAEEILRRQFLAFVIDTMVREGNVDMPRTMADALGSAESGTFLDQVLRRIETGRRGLVQRFAHTFAADEAPGMAALQAWILGDGTAGENVRDTIFRAVVEYNRDVERLRRRRKEIEDSLPELKALGETQVATDDDKKALQMALAAARLVREQIADLTTDRTWIAGLELRGLLPNYSLIDDNVELDVHASWYDVEEDAYDFSHDSITRGSARALVEFAPGAVFYAKGRQMKVNGIEISADASEVVVTHMCDTCGYGVDLAAPTDNGPTACPRCGSTGIADKGQRFESVRLKRVFSDQIGEPDRIDDRDESRAIARFEKLLAVDFDPDLRETQWAAKDVGLGVAAYRRLKVRTYNLGRANIAPASALFAGSEVSAQRFRVCDTCGKLDTAAGANSKFEHRTWCQRRNELTEHTRLLALHREIETQGVAVSLPPAVQANTFGPPSLAAALLLGMREVMGGAPDHLQVDIVPHPLGTKDGDTRTALLLHDTVPGGTGYLTDYRLPQHLWRVFVRAGRVLEACPCAQESRSSCHRCLLPFTHESQLVSRIEALHALRLVLGIDRDVGFVDVDESSATWQTVETTVDPTWGLSPLELKFRQGLADRIREIGTVKERSVSTGIELNITGLGSGHSWSLKPQVSTHGTKPDFVLSSNGGAAQVAIYTDGAAFHAGRGERNRLADDAIKRQTLRDHGYRVLAVTAADVAGSNPDPVWLSEQAIQKSLNLGLSQAAAKEQRGGALSLLIALMLQPDNPVRAKLAECLPMLLAQAGTSSRIMKVDPEQELAQIAAQALTSELDGGPADGARAVLYRRPHLVFLARYGVGAVPNEFALVLDDLDDAESVVSDPDFRDAWREWLHLSNVLAFSTVPTWIGTTSMVRSTATGGAPNSTANLPDGWGDLSFDLFDPAVAKLATALAHAGVQPPDADTEVDGIAVDMAWPSARVAVVYPGASTDEVSDIENAGWRVVVASEDLSATQQDVVACLKTRN